MVFFSHINPSNDLYVNEDWSGRYTEVTKWRPTNKNVRKPSNYHHVFEFKLVLRSLVEFIYSKRKGTSASLTRPNSAHSLRYAPAIMYICSNCGHLTENPLDLILTWSNEQFASLLKTNEQPSEILESSFLTQDPDAVSRTRLWGWSSWWKNSRDSLIGLGIPLWLWAEIRRNGLLCEYILLCGDTRYIMYQAPRRLAVHGCTNVFASDRFQTTRVYTHHTMHVYARLTSMQLPSCPAFFSHC